MSPEVKVKKVTNINFILFRAGVPLSLFQQSKDRGQQQKLKELKVLNHQKDNQHNLIRQSSCQK